MQDALCRRAPLDTHTFNPVIHSHPLVGNVVMAEPWLSWMACPPPCTKSFSILLDAVAKTSKIT